MLVSSCSVDGHPLEIKKLRGEEPVESIDLSDKGLTNRSAIIIAGLLPSNTATKSLKYVAAAHLFPKCQQPLTCAFLALDSLSQYGREWDR